MISGEPLVVLCVEELSNWRGVYLFLDEYKKDFSANG